MPKPIQQGLDAHQQRIMAESRASAGRALAALREEQRKTAQNRRELIQCGIKLTHRPVCP